MANDIPMARRLVTGKPSWYDKSTFYDRVRQISQDLDNTKKYMAGGDLDTAGPMRQRTCPRSRCVAPARKPRA